MYRIALLTISTTDIPSEQHFPLGQVIHEMGKIRVDVEEHFSLVYVPHIFVTIDTVIPSSMKQSFGRV